MNRNIALFLLGTVLSISAQALQIGGITVPDTLKAGETPLVLNGAGIRTKWMMDIYVGGLYLESSSSAANQIIAQDQPMAIKLHMVSGLITSEKMEDATMEGFKNATGGNTQALDTYIDSFMAVFREPISEGDVFDLIYQPGKGIDVYKNSEFKDTVDGGLPFKQAVFTIWLGKKPAHGGLKKGMLGK
jgi:hypothetical protein